MPARRDRPNRLILAYVKHVAGGLDLGAEASLGHKVIREPRLAGKRPSWTTINN
jgi:hypothetical protein